MLSCCGEKQITALDAILRVLIQQPLAAAEPATRPGALAKRTKPERENNCRPRRGDRRTRFQVGMMRTLENAIAFLVAPRQCGGERQPVEVRASQRRRVIRLREQL